MTTILLKSHIRGTALIVGLLFVASAALALTRLDNAYLWDDEAQVAIIGRNVVNTGHLTGWDGRNLFAYHDGALLDQNLRPINPPLDFLIAAGSFKLLGVSTWSARFPFVVIGLAALIVYWLLIRRIADGDDPAVLYAFALLALSTVFLLDIRTCRYFAPALLFSLLTLYSYYCCLESKKPVYYALLAGSAALLFYTQYLASTAFLLALAIGHVIYHRTSFQGSYRALAASAGLFLLATVPYAIRFQIWHRPDLETSGPSISKWEFVTWHLQQIVATGCISLPVLALLIGLSLRRREPWRYRTVALAWIALAIVYVIALVVLLPHPIVVVRYLTPLIPLGYGLSGLVLAEIDRKSRIGALALAIVLTSTTILSELPPRFGTFLLPGYLREISRPYPTGNEAAARYLAANAQRDDTVYACPEYLNYPLMFTIGDRVRMSDILDAKTPLPAHKLRDDSLYLFRENAYPNWFVAFGRSDDTYDMPGGTAGHLAYLSRPHQEGGKTVSYRYALVATLDTYWGQTQRSELNYHSYGPVTQFDRQNEAVYVYRREEP